MQWNAVASEELPMSSATLSYFQDMMQTTSSLQITEQNDAFMMATALRPIPLQPQLPPGSLTPTVSNGTLSISWSQTPERVNSSLAKPTSTSDLLEEHLVAESPCTSAFPSPAPSTVSMSSIGTPDLTTRDSIDSSTELPVNAVPHDASDTKEKRLMLRRKRNRENMRRSRLREKETLASLRATLEALEHKYQSFMGFEQVQSSTKRRLEKQLHDLIQCRRQLEAENHAMIQSMEQRTAFSSQLLRICDELDFDPTWLEKLRLLEYRRPKKRMFSSTGRTPSIDPPNRSFTPLTMAQIHQVIANFCREIEYVRSIGLGSHPPMLEVFGWQTRRQIDAQNQMHFCFTKVFRHLSAKELTERSWANGIDLENYKKKEASVGFRRLEFLQRVNDDIAVVLREVTHPDPKDPTIFRTHYMIFRVATSDGFAFGLQSINPQEQDQEQDEEHVVWTDVSISVEFFHRVCETTNEPYCEVRWYGKTNYKSPKHAHDNAVQFLVGVLRWETTIVGPRFHLTA